MRKNKFGKLYFCFVGLLGIFLLSHCQSAPSLSAISRVDAEQFIGVQFLDEAVDLQLATESGIDQIVYARFQLSPQFLDDFLTAMQLDTVVKPSRFPFPAAADFGPTWWLHEQPMTFVGGSQHTGNKVYELVVDQGDPEYYTIYLRVYQV